MTTTPVSTRAVCTRFNRFVKHAVQDVKMDVTGVKMDISDVKIDLRDVQSDVKAMQKDVKVLDDRLTKHIEEHKHYDWSLIKKERV